MHPNQSSSQGDDWFPMSNVWSRDKMARLLKDQKIVPYLLRGHRDATGKFIPAPVDKNPNEIQAATNDPKNPGETISGALTIQGGTLVFTPDNRVPKPPTVAKIKRQAKSLTPDTAFPAVASAPLNPATNERGPKANVPLQTEQSSPKGGGLLAKFAWRGKKNK